jgi:hypothetical protein
MIVIKLELHSAIDHSVVEIGRMYLCNDGSGSEQVGNYQAKIMRRGVTDFNGQIYRTGLVLNHARKHDSVWKLILKAIQSCVEGN